MDGNETTPQILFDKDSREFILELFDKTTDEKEYIVERENPKKRILTFELEELKLDRFGGIQKGSEIFIENNFVSLLRLMKLKG